MRYAPRKAAIIASEPNQNFVRTNIYTTCLASFYGIAQFPWIRRPPPGQDDTHTLCFSKLTKSLQKVYAPFSYTQDPLPHDVLHYPLMQETIIISVGGSLIVPDQIDTVFLSSLKALVEKEITQGKQFVIITGGGKTARRYQDAARTVTDLASEDVDWIGIHATRLNGHLLRTLFRDSAYRTMVTNPDDVLDIPRETPLIIAAGYRPGSSTDLRAVQIAERRGAKKLVNLSNIDYVYTADPHKDPAAQKIEETTWAEFRKLIPEEWDPGLSSPFDPVAAREADRLHMEVAIINGTNLTELEKYLEAKPFVGTVIR